MITKINFPFQIEACVEDFGTAKVSVERGADQIELCSRLDLDGLTPEFGDIELCLAQLSIPVKVMVRPVHDNFITTESNLSLMKLQIEELKQMGVTSIVLGLTTPQGSLDIDAIRILQECAYPMDISIHKAIDTCLNPLSELERLVRVNGIKSVLTSGGADTAINGARMIREMIGIAGSDIDIIAAGSITQDNVQEVHQLIGGSFYHGRKIVGDLNAD